MKKMNVGIDLRALSRREFLGTALKGGIATAGALMLPWDLALAEAKLNVGTMKIGDLSPFQIHETLHFVQGDTKKNLFQHPANVEKCWTHFTRMFSIFSIRSARTPLRSPSTKSLWSPLCRKFWIMSPSA